MFNKPEFKPELSEIVAFNRECLMCVSESITDGLDSMDYPVFMDDQIRNRKCTPKQVLKAWSKNKILWEYGYACYLSETSVRLIKKYFLFKVKKHMYKKEQELLSE